MAELVPLGPICCCYVVVFRECFHGRGSLQCSTDLAQCWSQLATVGVAILSFSFGGSQVDAVFYKRAVVLNASTCRNTNDLML